MNPEERSSLKSFLQLSLNQENKDGVYSQTRAAINTTTGKEGRLHQPVWSGFNEQPFYPSELTLANVHGHIRFGRFSSVDYPSYAPEPIAVH